MKNREKINSQTNLSSRSDSPIEKIEFKGRQIIDKTGPFLVQLKLNENERLEIHIENTVTFDNYSCVVRNEDMKRENTRSGNSFIETGSELFQIVEISLAQGYPFDRIVRVDERGKVVFTVDVKIDFKGASKKKVVIFEFSTMKQAISEVEKLKARLSCIVAEQRASEKALRECIEELRIQNQRLKDFVQVSSRRQSQKLSNIVSNAHETVDFSRELISSKSILVKHSTVLQTTHRLDIVLLSEPINTQAVSEWKLRMCNQMQITFGLCPREITHLIHDAMLEQLEEQSIKAREFFEGNQIVTCSFDGEYFRYTVERAEKEEEEEGEKVTSMGYSMRKVNLACKKLVNLQRYHAFVGLEFGGRVELLNYLSILD